MWIRWCRRACCVDIERIKITNNIHCWIRCSTVKLDSSIHYLNSFWSQSCSMFYGVRKSHDKFNYNDNFYSDVKTGQVSVWRCGGMRSECELVAIWMIGCVVFNSDQVILPNIAVSVRVTFLGWDSHMHGSHDCISPLSTVWSV